MDDLQCFESGLFEVRRAIIKYQMNFQVWANKGPYDIYRSDIPAFPERADNEAMTFSAALLYDFYYTIQWVNKVPREIEIEARSISE